MAVRMELCNKELKILIPLEIVRIIYNKLNNLNILYYTLLMDF